MITLILNGKNNGKYYDKNVKIEDLEAYNNESELIDNLMKKTTE